MDRSSSTYNGYRLSARAAAAEAAYRSGVAAPPPARAAIDSTTIISSDGPAMLEWFGGGGRAAGVTVTAQTAMRMSTVWRCVTLIAGGVMGLPLRVFRRTDNGGQERADDHPIARLLRDGPNDEMSGPDMVELATMAVMLQGNAYTLIRQARNGTVTGLDFYQPIQVSPFRSNGRVWYRFTNLDGSQEVHDADYVIHWRGPGRGADGICALSPIGHHAQTIGIGLATRDYTATQFERGLLTNDYFTLPDGITPAQKEEFRLWLEARASGVANANKPLILQGGADWKRNAYTAKDAQLLELLQYSSLDVARVFGVPGFMIGDMEKSTSWGTGIEQQGIGFVRYTLRPHLRRFAAELNRKLFPPVGNRRSEYFVEFEVDGLMEGDSKSQGEYFRLALGGNQLPGFMSVNEVRRLKNLPPIPDGNAVYVPPPPAPAGHNGGPPLDDDDHGASPDDPEEDIDHEP
ncbi:MAG: phage portal protein [Sphingomonas sp.]|nr:phage portal protein [Sphingomonas sp.]MDX3884040.1 phage portal protein [Sphingomonas sp.]